MLQCSRDNVRRLDKINQLKTGKRDRNGTFTYERREIEEFARRRGLSVKPSGELTAKVFALFKLQRSFQDICIETKQDPDTILALWERYQAGFEYKSRRREEDADARAAREHEEQMQAMDRELERRRRGVLFEDGREPLKRPGLTSVRDEPDQRATGNRRGR